MARITIPPYVPVPNGAGSGEAFQLGSGLAPLNFFRQNDAVNQKRAQQAAKLQEDRRKEDFKNFTLAPKLDGDAWSPFNEEVTNLKQGTLGRWEAVSQDKNLNSYQKDTTYNKDYAQFKGVLNATMGAKEAHKEFLAARKDVNAGGVRNGGILQEKMFDKLDKVDPVTGERKRIAALEFDPNSWNELDNDLDTYNIGAASADFVKRAFGDYEVDRTKAARPGGTGSVKSASSNIFKLNPATGEPLLDKEGDPIPNVDAPGLMIKANSDIPTKVFLDTMQREQQARLQPVVDKMGRNEPLTDEDRAIVEASDKTRADFLADYISSKGKLSVANRQTYLKPIAPRSSAASKPKSIVNTGQVNQGFTAMGGAANVGVEPNPTDIGFNDFFAGKKPNNRDVSAPNFGSYAHMPAPSYSTPSNPNGKPFKLQGVRVRKVFLPDENGVYSLQTNNAKPIYGNAQDGVAILRNRKTGEYKLPPADEAQATEMAKKLIAEGWEIGTGISVDVPKDKNFAAKYEARRASLQRSNDAMEVSDGSRRKTPQEIDDEAYEAAVGETVQAIVPYDMETAGSIDNQTAGSYKDFHRANRQKTASYGQLAPATGGLYSRKVPTAKAPASTQAAPKKPARPNNGGLY
jgi:hypothetical protein